jgi:hypothetical protein
MKIFILIFVLFLAVTGGFFYKTVLKGHVPFPGDLLVSEYSPWKYSSYLGYNPGSYPNKAQYFDTLRQLYPWKTFSLSSIKNNIIPLWNPYNFSGSPLMANFQSAIFYPFNIFYLILPQIWTWSILVILQPFLAMFFTFLYARKIGISTIGSVFSSLTFAYGSFMSVWLQYNTIGHVILWLPLILLCMENLLGKKRLFWIFLLVFSIASSLFAGHIQIFTYLFLFALIYVFVRARNLLVNFKKNTMFFLFLLTASLGIGAIQIIPGVELIINSARSPHEYDFIVNKILIQFWQLIMLVVPDFFGNPATRNYWINDTYIGDVIYIGLVQLIFVALAFGYRFKNYFVNVFFLSSFFVFVFITNNPLTQIIYSSNIPFVSSSSSTLLVFLLSFSLSMLCGFGVDHFIKNKYSYIQLVKKTLLFFVLFIILWSIVIAAPKFSSAEWVGNLTISFRNLLYSSLIFFSALMLFGLAIFKNKIKYAAIVLLLLLSVFDLWRFFVKFNPFSPVDLTFPKTEVLEFVRNNNGINRYWGYGSAAIEANFATLTLTFSTDGYDPLYPKRYGELISSSKDGRIEESFSLRNRSDAYIVGGYGEEDLMRNESRLKILDSLGVSYILDRMENGSTLRTFPEERFSLIYEKNGWKIFENLESSPRAFLTNEYKIFSTKDEFSSEFFKKDFDVSKTIFLEESPGFKTDNSLVSNNSVDILSYSPNEIVISTESESESLLFLSDTYYPGWKAYLNGIETKIYRANYAFRAVKVDQGDSEIRFIYDPDSFKIGVIVSAISVASLVGFIVFKKYLKSYNY